MPDFREEDELNWKRALRSELIKALNRNQRVKDEVYAQIGYYYSCYAPAFLYKYYSDKIERLETVKAGKMWYSAPCHFNDVFDCDVVIDEERIFNSVLQMVPGKGQIRKGSPAWWKIKREISRDLRPLKTVFDGMKTSMGISCFSETDDNLLMWAHYANNHSGMCVEYELLEINKQLNFSPVPVIYSDERTVFDWTNLDAAGEDAMHVFTECITSKSQEWSYEKEWRIIRDHVACGANWDAEKKGALLDMIHPSSVILGCMAKPEFESMVRKYCEESEINLYKMKKDTYLYRLEKVPVLQFDR